MAKKSETTQIIPREDEMVINFDMGKSPMYVQFRALMGHIYYILHQESYQNLNTISFRYIDMFRYLRYEFMS